MANPVNWFEIPANDIERAKKFYEAIFGYDLSFQEMGAMKMAWFPMEQGAEYATGTLIQGDQYVPSYNGTLVYFNVNSIENTLKKIEENGGKKLTDKIAIGEHGFIAKFEDSEGNRVALHGVK